MTLPANIQDRHYQNYVEDARGNPLKRVTFGDTALTDAFGRLRVSNPITLFDCKQLADNQPLLFDDQEVSGSGTSSTFSADKASSTLAVTASTAGKRVRQSFQRFNYQPGKSLQALITGQFIDSTTSESGITTQMGIFDDDNGVFLSYESGTMSAVVRSSVTGSAVDDEVAQSDWNVDKMDGSGPSGITADWTKTQIIVIDYEWLGVGRVRVGLVVEGSIFYVHQFFNANLGTTVYMSRPNLPIRYSIENDATGGARSMQAICCSVSSEGGVQGNGVIHSASTGTTALTATTSGTYYCLIALRLNTSYFHSAVDLLRTAVLMTSAGSFEWRIYYQPTIAGSLSYSQITNSGVEVAYGDSTNSITSPGTHIYSGFGSSSGSGQSAGGTSTGNLENALRLGSTIAGAATVLALAVTGLADGETFVGTVNYRELT